MDQTSSRAMTGRVIGNYELLEKIGEGGMGAVYRGLDRMLEREVAVKVLRPELGGAPQVAERFRSEAVTLARLNHPNIATLYSFFQEDEELFMVMEFVHGYTLEALLKRQGALPPDRALPLFGQILDGIGHAHVLGVVHRDVKPANVMITDAGLVKVMDFGIARMLGTARMTRTGHLIGTLEYMSPEQIRGEEIDARSDVYALGILLYEMLTGRVPFDSDSDFKLMRAQVEAPPPPPRSLQPGLPEAIEQALLRALEKDPADRFQTVEDFRDALDVPASDGPPVPRAPKPTRLAEAGAVKATRLAAPAVRARLAALRGTLTWKHIVAFGAVPLALMVLLLVIRGPGGEPASQQAEASTDSTAQAAFSTPPSEAEEPVVDASPMPGPARPAQPEVIPLDQYRRRTPASPENRRQAPAQSARETATPPADASTEEAPAPRTGQLRVVVRPYGDIYVAGRQKARETIRPYTEALPPGTYRVRAVHPVFGVWEKQVTVQPGETREVLFNFNEEYRLTVTSEPPHAEILVDGQPAGRYTPSVLTLRPGRHTIEVRKSGYRPAGGAREVMVDGNAAQPLHFSLQRRQ